MKRPLLGVIALAMAVSAFAQTSVPAAPTLTAGAEFKGLRLDWDTVPGAVWYQLELRAHQTGPFVKQGGDLPATATSTRFTFPLHFYDWTYARYRLAACNSAGCSRSPEVSVSNLRRDAVGYFKAAQPAGGASFGDATDLSTDGNNMVASAPFEYTSQTSDTVAGGAAYVFGRDASGKWYQRVRLQKDAVASYEEDIRMDVAISASGNTVAIGMPTTKVANSDQEGEVDIHHYKNGVWSRTRIPRLPVANFASTVALDDSGYILAVGLTDSANSVAIYKSINGVWTHLRDLGLTEGGYPQKCDKPVLSRDGRVIAERCEQPAAGGIPRRDFIRVYSGSNWADRAEIFLRYAPFPETHYFYGGIGIDRTGGTIAVQYSEWTEGTPDGVGAVTVFKRYNGEFLNPAVLKPGSWRSSSERFTFGDSVSVSGDGLTIAVGDWKDNGTGFGPRAAPLVSGTDRTGAVYLFHLTDAWRLVNMVKPNYKPADPLLLQLFGNRSAVNGDGRTLIIPVPTEASSAKGIDGNWANDDLGYSGAIFMY